MTDSKKNQKLMFTLIFQKNVRNYLNFFYHIVKYIFQLVKKVKN